MKRGNEVGVTNYAGHTVFTWALDDAVTMGNKLDNSDKFASKEIIHVRVAARDDHCTGSAPL